MPRRARPVWPGCPFHITQKGNNGQVIFQTEGDFRIYLEITRKSLDRAGVRILAYALMNNHVHIVAVPEYGDGLSHLFRRLSGGYAHYSNLRTGSTGRIWQSRYYSAPMSPLHLHYALRYVEMNPVRAGLVANPGSYRWSSAPAHFGGGDPFGVLDMEYWKQRGGSESWIRMVEAPRYRTREMEHYLRVCTYAERPFGDEEFLRKAEERLGQSFKRWPFSHSLASDEVTFRLDHLPGEE